GDGGLGPVVVVGEIGPLGDPQLVQQHLAAKVQGQSGVGVPVDAPALVGVFPVGAVFKDAVDGVAGGKDRLAPGLDVGRGVGVIAGIPVMVVEVEGQIAPEGQLLGQGQPGPDQWLAAIKDLGVIGVGQIPEGDVVVDFPATHI